MRYLGCAKAGDDVLKDAFNSYMTVRGEGLSLAA